MRCFCGIRSRTRPISNALTLCAPWPHAQREAPPGSEAWVNAHVTLSRLDKIRDDSVAAVRAFDGLIADANASDSGLAEMLTDAQKLVADDVAAQNDEIRRLSRLIGE